MPAKTGIVDGATAPSAGKARRRAEARRRGLRIVPVCHLLHVSISGPQSDPCAQYRPGLPRFQAEPSKMGISARSIAED
ncbi:hypothetical protein Y88_3674 [Novosphingobium nitrogenifigens DSM 19370]|uniref:Uncharacterized protein n=1 Tax=Novosphingobium nitrogenifigens DSM 19370 TaxID=983920 RepID=F1ZDQ3_9SPHN|nr:hypothetical protein Y88_3674 [Novosphingobium nitrogenifigens DSM 19370]